MGFAFKRARPELNKKRKSDVTGKRSCLPTAGCGRMHCKDVTGEYVKKLGAGHVHPHEHSQDLETSIRGCLGLGAECGERAAIAKQSSLDNLRS